MLTCYSIWRVTLHRRRDGERDVRLGAAARFGAAFALVAAFLGAAPCSCVTRRATRASMSACAHALARNVLSSKAANSDAVRLASGREVMPKRSTGCTAALTRTAGGSGGSS